MGAGGSVFNLSGGQIVTNTASNWGGGVFVTAGPLHVNSGLVAGNPAKAIRTRFDPETVKSLLTIQWWDWPLPKIIQLSKQMQSPDVEAFIRVSKTIT